MKRTRKPSRTGRGLRFLSGALVFLLLAGLIPLLPNRPVMAEEGTGLPPLGYYSYKNKNQPNVKIRFDTGDLYLIDFMKAGGQKSGEVRKVLEDLMKGNADNAAVEEIGKLLMLDTTLASDDGGGFTDFIRHATDSVLEDLDKYGNYKTVLTWGDGDAITPDKLKFFDDYSNAFGAVGLTLSIYDLVVSEAGSEDERDKALSLFTSAFTALISTGGAAIDEMSLGSLGNFKDATWGAGIGTPLGIAMFGLTLVDTALKDLHAEGVRMRTEAMENIYYYYNEIYNKPKPQPLDKQKRPKPGEFQVATHDGAWNMGEWRDSYIAIIDKYAAEDPSRVMPEIEKLIDDYCERFWELPASKQAELETDLDMKTGILGITQVSTEDWSKDGRNGKIRKELTDEYKAHLKAKLAAVNGALLKEYSRRLVEPIETTVNKRLEYLNEPFGLKILQPEKEVDGETVCPYDGYIVRLKFITDEYKANCLDKLTVTLNGPETPYVKNMTVLGHINSGGGLELDFWAPDQDPDKDKPEFTEEFSLDAKGHPKPIELEAEDADLAGKYALKIKGDLDAGVKYENMDSMLDMASVAFLNDIFASNVNNIGKKNSLTVEIKEGKKGTYDVIYRAKQGDTSNKYEGDGFVYDPKDATFKGEIKIQLSDAYVGARGYVMAFDLKVKDEDNMQGHLVIKNGDRVYAEYDIALKRKK